MFYYVDRIHSLESGQRITGVKNVTRTEPYIQHLPDGRSVLNPFVVSEAVAQLGGFLFMEMTNFEQRAILLADDETLYPHLAEAGDQIRLSVELVSRDDEVVVTRGTAHVGDKLIVDGLCCRGYLMPMAELSDPEDLQRQFKRLYRPEFAAVSVVEPWWRSAPLPWVKATPPVQFLEQADVDHGAGKVVATKALSERDEFFKGHFPRKPVVPGVIQLSLVAEAAQMLCLDPETGRRPTRLMPVRTTRGRLRKFIEPGDLVVAKVTLTDGDPRRVGDTIKVQGVLEANGKRVMQTTMELTVMPWHELTTTKQGRTQSRQAQEPQEVHNL